MRYISITIYALLVLTIGCTHFNKQHIEKWESVKPESSRVLGVSEMHEAVALAVTKFNAFITTSNTPNSRNLNYQLTGVRQSRPSDEFNRWEVNFSPVIPESLEPPIILGRDFDIIVDLKENKHTITPKD